MIFRGLFSEHNPREIGSAFHPSTIVPTYGAGRAGAEIGQKDHLWTDNRTYLKNKVRVQGKAWSGEKAEHTRSM